MTEETLEAKTGRYWHLSRAWRGRDPQTDLRIGAAMAQANGVLKKLNPSRLLARLCSALIFNMIVHTPGKKFKRKRVQNVVRLRAG